MYTKIYKYMIPNIFYVYLALARKGLVEDIQCPDEHGTLFANFDPEKDRVALECTGCSYTIYPGLNMYDKMQKAYYKFYLSDEYLNKVLEDVDE